MEITTLKAKRRTALGTRAARRLRDGGELPVIIYGHGEEPESVSVGQHDVEVALAHGARMVMLDVDGASTQCLIKDVQYDYLGQSPIHIDLTRVDLNELVTVRVGIELRGIPKGAAGGGLLDQMMPGLEVECMVRDIPDTLRPSVVDLELNESLLVKDLELPSGVRALANGEDRVATIRALATAAAEPEEEEEEAEGEAEEPERIGRARKEEEPADGKKS